MLAFPIPLGTGQLCIQQQPQIDVRDGLAQSRACVHSASQAIGQPVLRYCVSIPMPLYNEEKFVATAIVCVLQASLPAGMDRELIVIDDGSTDGSAEIVMSIAREHPGVIRLIRHPQNRGKGAAIRTAIHHAEGKFCLIQDADLEYNPEEYPKLLKPLLSTWTQFFA